MKIILLLAITCILSGCLHAPQFAGRVHLIEEDVNVKLASSSDYSAAEMTLQFLGVGGFAFEVNGEKIITAPFYTNIPFLKNIPFRSIQENKEVIDRRFPNHWKDSNNVDERMVKAIVVGHSHYDHLLDVPHLMETHIQKAKAYGSTTMTAILNKSGISNVGPSARAFSVNQKADDKDYIDIPDSNIRIWPIKSSHAPHLFGHTFQKGHYKLDEQFTLRTAGDWAMGTVYAYVIDFMDDDGRVLFRVYYQDSANAPTAGLIHENILNDKRKVDIAILTLAGSSNVASYPASRVKDTNAELFVVGHWEDFFGIYKKDEYVIARGSDERKFISNLEKAMHKQEQTGRTQQWLLPSPGTTIVIKREM